MDVGLVERYNWKASMEVCVKNKWIFNAGRGPIVSNSIVIPSFLGHAVRSSSGWKTMMPIFQPEEVINYLNYFFYHMDLFKNIALVKGNVVKKYYLAFLCKFL